MQLKMLIEHPLKLHWSVLKNSSTLNRSGLRMRLRTFHITDACLGSPSRPLNEPDIVMLNVKGSPLRVVELQDLHYSPKDMDSLGLAVMLLARDRLDDLIQATKARLRYSLT